MKSNLLRTLLLLIICTWSFNANSQNLDWAKHLGGADDEVGTSIAVDEKGNVYTAGVFRDTVDFDPGAGTYYLRSAGSTDIFVSKLDSAGNFLWAKRMGGELDDYASAMAVDANGFVYTTGSFRGTADFDPDTGTYYLTTDTLPYHLPTIYISKLDSSGNFIWAKQMQICVNCNYYYSEESAGATAITLDVYANVYTTGSFTGTIDFDPGPDIHYLETPPDYGQETSNVFVSKIDSSGNFIWAKQMGGSQYDCSAGGNAISVDFYGNVYTTGTFEPYGDFDPGPGEYLLIANLWNDPFISKLDSAGNFVWAKQVTCNNQGWGDLIKVDNSSEFIYITGRFVGNCDLNPGAGNWILSSGFGSNFILKLDLAGNFVWGKQLGARINSLACSSIGKILTTGFFSGTSDLDPGNGAYQLTSGGGSDIFVSMLDTSGNLIGAIQMGGQGNDGGNSVDVDASLNIYVTGGFQDTADFDPGAGVYNLMSEGNNDVFVVKLSDIATVINQINGTSIQNILLTPNPAHDLLTLVLHSFSEGGINSSYPNSNSTITVYDVAGRKFFPPTTVLNNSVQVNTSSLPDGIYTLQIINNMSGESGVGKFVKE